MGRPNWCRRLACSTAISRHRCAPPTCSAASAAIPRSRTRDHPAPSPSRRTGTPSKPSRCRGRLSSIVTYAARREGTASTSAPPAYTSTSSPSSAYGATPVSSSPSRRSSPSPGSTTVALTPPASASSNSSAPQAAAASTAMTADWRKGWGDRTRPSSSATAAISTGPHPVPPCFSGTSSPAIPTSRANSRHEAPGRPAR